MRTPAKILSVLLFMACAGAGFAAQERSALLEQFEFQGRKYSITDRLAPAASGLVLEGPTRMRLSAGMPGENILLGTRSGSDNFRVFWLNRSHKTLRLAYYDHRRQFSRLLPITGFSFIALPEIVEADGELRGLVFLGNRSDNDDIFYYEPETDQLTALTGTPFSEKGFTLRDQDGRLEILTRSLWAQFRYGFDPAHRKSTLLEKTHFPPRLGKSARSAAAPDYYNTYLGFGDSITWGEVEGVRRLDLCYLTQMQTLLADPGYADYYGASTAINLGVPGDDTLDGALRVEQELEDHAGFYFLLMLGVNDLIRINLSVDSSLENLAFIIDAAKADGRRVIVSTPTPSKSHASSHPYYWENLSDLSSGILALAREKEIASIDAMTLFMETNPPDGWKDLLEEIIPGISSGNHPNAEGHRLIAGLFGAALVKFPPLPPQNVIVIDPGNALRRTASWDVNYESDFSHFRIEFGFRPEALDYSLDTAASYYTFNLFPFLPQVYFHIRTVDRGQRPSGSAAVSESDAANGPRWEKTK